MDRVTGQEVEFHLGILHARQDGQAIVWVAVTMLLIVALFVAGVGIAQLMLFRWDAQGAADAAALAGANIQAQGLMSLAFLNTIIYARNAMVSVLYFTAAALGAICVACLIGVGCWACPLAPQVLNTAIQFENDTAPAVKAIRTFQQFIRWVFPFYATANVTWYGWKNGALAIGLPFPLPLKWPEAGDDTSDSKPDMSELGQQLAEINNCIDLVRLSGGKSAFQLERHLEAAFSRLEWAYYADDFDAMRAALRELKTLNLHARMQIIIDMIDLMEDHASQCHVEAVDDILAARFQCSATITCDNETKTDCTYTASGQPGFVEYLHALRRNAEHIQDSLGEIDGCLARDDEEERNDCTEEIAHELLFTYYNLKSNANKIVKDLLEARSDELEACIDCVGKATMETDRCRLEEQDEESSKEWGLNGMFAVVWRRSSNPDPPADTFDLDSQLWRGQSVGTVYAAAFGSPTRVQDSSGECHRCLLESVDIGPLKKIPLLEKIIDGLIFFLYVMVGKDTKHCRTPEWARTLPAGGILGKILGFLSDILEYITKFFTGQERPDVCERRPILTRVDVGLTYGLGLEEQRSQITTYVLDILDKYNDPAKRWNNRLDDFLNTVPGIWTYFPEVKEVLLKLRLPIYDRPNLTGPLF